MPRPRPKPPLSVGATHGPLGVEWDRDDGWIYIYGRVDYRYKSKGFLQPVEVHERVGTYPSPWQRVGEFEDLPQAYVHLKVLRAEGK